MFKVVQKVRGAVNHYALRGVVYVQTTLMALSSELIATKSATAQTLGGAVSGLTSDIALIPALLAGVAYAAGLGFVVHGLIEWRKHSKNPNAQISIMGIIVEMLAGVALISATTVVVLTQGTLKLTGSNTVSKPNF